LNLLAGLALLVTGERRLKSYWRLKSYYRTFIPNSSTHQPVNSTTPGRLPMSRSLLILTAVALFAPSFTGSPVQAQEAVSLTYAPTYEVGAKQEADVRTRSDQILTVAGQNLETHANTHIQSAETAVEAVDGGRKWKGEFTLIESEIQAPGGLRLTFNSNNPDLAGTDEALAPLVEALKATAGAKWTAETNADHELVKFEYVDNPFANVDAMLRGSTDPESMKRSNAIELKRYPADPVKPGDTWTRTEESDLGGGQTLTLEKEYTYVGSEQRDGRTMDKVTVKVLSTEYKMDPASPSPAKVTESELEVTSSAGTYWYDREAGMFTERTDEVRMKGTLTLEAGGQKLPGELDLSINTAVKSKIVAP
jgi:hypothetical protein